MWQADIASKRYENGTLFVDVIYNNGAIKFIENLNMTGGTTDGLASRIQSKLDSLNQSDTLFNSVTLGSFSKQADKPATSQDLFQTALRTHNSIQKAIDLGLVQKGGKEETDAISTLKSLYDPSFLNLLS